MLGIDRRALRVIWTLFLAALVLAIVYYIRSTILLLAISVFFAYMLSPIVGLVERFVRKRRGLALAVVYVARIRIDTAVCWRGNQFGYAPSGSGYWRRSRQPSVAAMAEAAPRSDPHHPEQRS